MSEDNRDYTSVNHNLIERERAKFERLQAKAEAAKENMVETMAAMLKQLEMKKALLPDVIEARKDEAGNRLKAQQRLVSGEGWGGSLDND